MGLKPRWCAGTGPPAPAPSRRMDAPPGRLGAHTPRPLPRRFLPGPSGWTKGAWPQARRRLKGLLARGCDGHGCCRAGRPGGYRWGPQAAPSSATRTSTRRGQCRVAAGALLGARTRHHAAAGTLAPALGHCRKVPRSDWPGLFPGSTGPDLPRTNKDLEQCCGAYRSHDRRTPGRKGASPREA